MKPLHTDNKKELQKISSRLDLVVPLRLPLSLILLVWANYDGANDVVCVVARELHGSMPVVVMMIRPRPGQIGKP